eukprot:1507120-Pyramimonas_sp.AAC.1
MVGPRPRPRRVIVACLWTPQRRRGHTPRCRPWSTLRRQIGSGSRCSGSSPCLTGSCTCCVGSCASTPRSALGWARCRMALLRAHLRRTTFLGPSHIFICILFCGNQFVLFGHFALMFALCISIVHFTFAQCGNCGGHSGSAGFQIPCAA